MKMVYVLVAAATAAGLAAFTSFGGAVPASSPATPAAPVAMEMAAPTSEPVDSDPGSAVEGEVLEVIDVPSYSYLRLGAKGTEGTWVAVSTATLEVGDHARISGATKMPGFTSTTLKRTFPVIYFGALDEGKAPPGHAAMAGHDDRPTADGADPHQGMSGKATVEVKKVERAAGPGGKTVAEILGQRTSLAGKTIRLQATVVKATTGVLGRTYLHVQDGSGDASLGTNDLSVTTTATPAVGQVITIEGVVALDRDIGSGYKFPTLIEDARVL